LSFDRSFVLERPTDVEQLKRDEEGCPLYFARRQLAVIGLPQNNNLYHILFTLKYTHFSAKLLFFSFKQICNLLSIICKIFFITNHCRLADA